MEIQPTSMAATTPARYASGASESFIHQTANNWTQQRLDSPTGQKFLQVISQKTGISTDDLKSKLESGVTLKDILQQSGVSFADIRAAVRQQGGVQGTGHHRHRGGPANEQVESAVLGAVAGKLGMDEAGLKTQLQGGATLDALASQKGVSSDDLAKAIEQALQDAFSTTAYGTNGVTTPQANLPPAQVDETV